MKLGRDQFRGQRLAVIGLGVSGIAMTEAATQLGAEVTVFEEKPGDVPAVVEAVDRLAGCVDVVTGWTAQLPSGFDLVLVSPGIPPGHPVMRQTSTPLIGEAEFAYQISRAPILAVTGTNGKSTTVVMLSRILLDHGAILCGNISGSGYAEEPLTAAALRAGESDVLIAEVSSAQLETVKDFTPLVASITNIRPDHMDRYQTFEQYKSAKLNLLANLGSDQVFVLNLDEPSVDPSWAPRAKCIGFSPSGQKPGNGVTRRTADGLAVGQQKIPLAHLPFLGEMNIANAMTALEMAAAFLDLRGKSITEREVANFLTFRPLAHRLELLGRRGGVTVINNSMCTNPQAVIASCKSLSENLHILMGGNPKNLDFSELAQFLKDSPHKVYLYGADADVLGSKLNLSLPRFGSLELAFESAVTNAQSGETIILAPGCSSSAPYTNFRERGDAFKIIAKEWLDETKTPS